MTNFEKAKYLFEKANLSDQTWVINLEKANLRRPTLKGPKFRWWVTNFVRPTISLRRLTLKEEANLSDQTWVTNFVRLNIVFGNPKLSDQLWKAKCFFEEANLTRLERPTLKRLNGSLIRDQLWKAKYFFDEANFERINISLRDQTREANVERLDVSLSDQTWVTNLDMAKLFVDEANLSEQLWRG